MALSPKTVLSISCVSGANVFGLSHNEMNKNNKQLLRSNTKGYGGKIRYTESQNSDKTAPSGRELYRIQFSLQAASPETFGYTLVQEITFYLRRWYEVCSRHYVTGIYC
jgi:hypothetical protein